jgi:putative endopeptidase
MKRRMVCILSICMAIMLFAGDGMAAGISSVKDDFYEAVNGEWIASAVIPADQPVVGGFTDLSDDVQEALMEDFEAMLGGANNTDNKALTNFLEFYRLALDFKAREAAGSKPLLSYMQMVEDLASLSDFAGQWAQRDLQEMPAPFEVGHGGHG